LIPNLVWISNEASEEIEKINGAPFSGPSLSLAVNCVIVPGD
jgi:hypothetical protein